MFSIIFIFAVGAQFIDYCQKKGWIISKVVDKNKEWYLTEKRENELKKFNIVV